MSANELINQWNEALVQAMTSQPEAQDIEDLDQAETQEALHVRTGLRAGQSSYWQGMPVSC